MAYRSKNLDATAAGNEDEIQFNTSGLLDASSSFKWNSDTNTLTVGGNIVISGTVDGVDVSSLNDANYVKLTGNQTIQGVKTFDSFPVTPSSYPTTDYQTSNKKYVDDYQHHWTEILSSETVTIPIRRQMTVHGNLIIDGELYVDGSLVMEN